MKPYPKYFEKIRVRPDPDAELKARAPACQWDGCTQAGTHRAPVGRMKEGEYFRFCFDHVREYNKGFNYFSGLADTEIARFQKEALTGHRPTWKMGTAGGVRSSPDFAQQRSGRAGYYRSMRDPFNLFGDGRERVVPRERKARPLEAKAPRCSRGRGRDQGALQGAGETPSSGREWRGPRLRRAVPRGAAGIPTAQAGRFVLSQRRIEPFSNFLPPEKRSKTAPDKFYTGEARRFARGDVETS
jgi:hypothetical protein